MADVLGTPVGINLDGINYNVASDANFSLKHHQFENEAIATSGPTYKKMTKKPALVESVDLTTNFDEYNRIVELNDRKENFPIGWTDAGGNNYKGVGFIILDARESETGKTSIQIVNDTGYWSPFKA